MNKTIALLILGVILLAMALIMVNQYMTQPEGTAMTPGGSAPLAVSPAVPQSASPDAVLSQLEQRAATSELAPREMGGPVSPPMPQSMPQNVPPRSQTAPQTMPAWASNGGASAAPGAVPGVASGGTALTPPSTPNSPSTQATSQGNVPTASAAPAAAASAKPEQAKPVPAKAETGKAESAKSEQPKPKAETAKAETPKVEQPKPAKPKGPKTIKKIAIFRVDDEVVLRVEGSEAVTYKTMQLKSPDRLVLDLDGEWAIKAPGVPDNKLISNVRIGKQADKTRIVVDLKQNPQTVRYLKRGAEGFDVRMK